MDQRSAIIDRSIVDAILAGRLRPGARLGEQAVASVFDVSRTVVREALIRLEMRGLVQVSPRRGWFVVEPSLDDVIASFQARRAIETGILRTASAFSAESIATLRDHIARERDAIAANDIAARSYLLADFHVCMVECLHNRILADILRDLTARTILIAALSQSAQDATVACDEHEQITNLLADGKNQRAAQQMVSHIDNVEAGLTRQVPSDPLIDLRIALQHPLKTEKGSE
ncbi:MAG: GntR family transcriptional regulator [Rhodopila sp.]|jgi:DNA-binding GntR family transcriptional regulator